MTELAADRLDTLVIARLATAGRRPRAAAVMDPLRRFSPRDLTDAQWRQALAGSLEGLRARGLVEGLRVPPGELARRIGGGSARGWPQLADRVLPALALGIAPDDAKAHKRLSDRDAWAAAIAARALDLWRAGPPPSLGALCDSLVWRELGIAGPPERCPPGLRAHFMRPHAGGDAGPPERHVRMLAARSAEAPRAELRALREGLVRVWLAGRQVGAAMAGSAAVTAGAAATSPGTATAAASVAIETTPGAGADAAPRSLIADARAAAAAARRGVFGERKVFISAVWEALRAMPAWTSLELDELKARLVAAHRNRELVLARADLVAAMDPALVAASETRTDGATFHFIIREPGT